MVTLQDSSKETTPKMTEGRKIDQTGVVAEAVSANITANNADGSSNELHIDVNEKPLWAPEDPSQTNTARFMEQVKENYGAKREDGKPLVTYEDLYYWSTTHLQEFWSAVWDFVGVVGERPADCHVVDDSALPVHNPDWFRGSKLNWAENMLRKEFREGAAKDRTALIQVVEPKIGEDMQAPRRMTYGELYARVANVVSSLLDLGLQPGDRVGAYSSNSIENVIACLAATAIGCIWVSAAADFGPEGVFERFEQVKPKVIFSVDGVVYNGKVHQHLPKLSSLLQRLESCGCSPLKVVVVNAIGAESGWNADWTRWDDFVKQGEEKKLGIDENGEILWKRMDFNWPLWVLFSSGTTGRPKPIVHRAGGMLLQARKELALCSDIRPDDIYFYYTTTGWMMWNYLIAGLANGCTLVLYDGSPLRDPSFLWRLVDELGITIFGTSAKYIDQLSKVYKPREHHRLHTLRHIYSTGSPLAASSFDFVYEHIHPNIHLASITGGTDICSLFAGVNTALPVYRGEIQCRMLGMAIEAFSPDGKKCAPGVSGELVCTRPFPCQPAGFWPLRGFAEESAVEEAQKRYQAAYFAEYDGVWYHGDHVVVTASRSGNGGGVVMLGRSDGVLNPGGVRFGSAELYDVVELAFKPSDSLPAQHVISDCLAVGQKIAGGTDERVILFVKLEGERCSEELVKKIKTEIRARRSARHVPERIIQVEDIPYTLNGKRVEVPVKKIINGAPIRSVNAATLRNPECLTEYETIGRALREEVS